MAQAGLPSITRRGMFASALGVALALPLVAQADHAASRRRAFIDEIADKCAMISPIRLRGREAATRAMSMGLEPDDCAGYVFYEHPGSESGVGLPVLHFRNAHGGLAACVGPDGAI